MNAAPNRNQWEIVQSWWVLLPFFGLGWLAFFYIGLRVGYKKWQFFGLIYLLPFLLWLVTSGSVLGQLAGFLVGLSIITSIAHVFFVRRPFLTRLEMLQQQNLQRNEIMYQLTQWSTLARGMISTAQSSTVRERVRDFIKDDPNGPANTLGESAGLVSAQRSSPQPGSASFTARNTSLIIEVNNATEQEIATLPGMTDILAKRVVALRQERGDFSSLDEFSAVLGLKPHIVERLRPLVAFSSHGAVQESETEQRTRKIDFGQSPITADDDTRTGHGREVDF